MLFCTFCHKNSTFYMEPSPLVLFMFYFIHALFIMNSSENAILSLNLKLEDVVLHFTLRSSQE